MRGGLIVWGTGSDVGKSHVVAGLCRLLARDGVRAAPFKAQNMSLNSFVTPRGHEIGRAQGVQALAAGIVPEVAMNPILLKPTTDQSSEVVVMGQPIGTLDAAGYEAAKPRLRATVLAAAQDLHERFDVLVAEGAGSPAEINLLDHDLANHHVARELDLPAVVVGDIDRGGVFAALYGTVMLLPDPDRARVRGFVINKFRGDPALLGDGAAQLEARCHVPTLGVLPWVEDLRLDAEDSVTLTTRGGVERTVPDRAQHLDVAVVRFPRIANFTDFDPLVLEPRVRLRYVATAGELGDPDLVVLPGTKATVADLRWLRDRGLDRAVLRSRALVLGICGGYQMLGRVIHDDVESGQGRVAGLDWLDVDTVFAASKLTRQRRGVALSAPVAGYEIHRGRVRRGARARPWIALDDPYGTEDEGATDDERFMGTSLHGLLECDELRATFLTRVAHRAAKAPITQSPRFGTARERQFDRLADLLAAHLDLGGLYRIIDPTGA